MSSGSDGLVYAARVAPDGRSTPLGWDEIRAAARGGSELLWIHLDLGHATSKRWLETEAGLTELQIEALEAEETRPRSTPFDDGLLVILRGVNLNPGADPEDMVALRVWAEADRIITLRRRRVMATDDLRGKVAAGHGPTSAAALLAELADLLSLRTEGEVERLDGMVDELEDELLTGQRAELRGRLADLRRRAIGLRRYLAPQREVLARLAIEPMPWIGDRDRIHLREVADRVTRLVEDLDAARERAAVHQEELASRMAEEMNRTMYLISIVAAVFLPLSFLTGLLGINVAGIPGADVPWAFAAVCGIATAIAGLELWLFRRLRWL